MKFRDHPLDLRKELVRFGGDGGRLSQVARLFIAETPLRIEAVCQAVRTKDSAAVCEAADGLKTMLRAFDAPQAAAVAEEVEHCGRARDFGHAKMLVIALRRDTTQLLETVKAWSPMFTGAGMEAA
jgi:HPt (histidine-containing phosphotransfer) domain-containing protein